MLAATNNNNIFAIFAKFKARLGMRLYLVLAMAGVLTVLESVGFTLFYPLISKSIDPITEGGDTSANYILVYFEFWSFNAVLALIAVVFCLKGIVQYIIDFQINTNKALLGDLIRVAVISKANLKSNQDYKTLDSYKYSNLINEQVNQSALSFQYFCQFFGHLSAVFIYSTFAINFSFVSFAVAIGLGILVYIIFNRLNKVVKSLSNSNSFASLELTYKSLEVFSSVQYLQATKSFSQAREDLSLISRNVFEINKKLGRANAITKSIREPLAVLIVVTIIYITTQIYGDKILSALVSILFIYKISTSMFGIQGNWQNTIGHIGALDRIYEELDEKMRCEKFALLNPVFQNSETYNRPTFTMSYSLASSSRTVEVPLSELDFQIGKINLISGRSGVGKSTFFDALAGIKSFQCFDSDNSKNSCVQSYRFQWRTVGYMTQNNFLIGGSLFENICYPRDMSELNQKEHQEVENLIKELNLGHTEDEIYDKSRIKIDGSGLSGGQKQRLFLARELFRRPELLLLDEPTSAQDKANEDRILNALQTYGNNSIVFVISHDDNIKKIAHREYKIK